MILVVGHCRSEDGRVLFLVPSLSLLSQTLTEWTQESEVPLHSFAVCSDSDVGKKRKVDDDVVQTFTHELRYPATTEPARLASEMAKRHDPQQMSVVLSTYHSIDVISQAQKKFDLDDFDLIVCDEAHRTTGATFDGQEESAFVRVHNADFIQSAKRVYMTATPRIYGDNAKASAEKDNVAVEETHVNRRIQSLLADENNQLKIEPNNKSKTHKVSSKNIAGMFQAVVEAYQETEEFETVATLTCEAAHVDGGMNASQKEEKLNWLKADAPENTCRILSNVRCLSEGVDVPALDAVLFLTPRNSQVDVRSTTGTWRTLNERLPWIGKGLSF